MLLSCPRYKCGHRLWSFDCRQEFCYFEGHMGKDTWSYGSGVVRNLQIGRMGTWKVCLSTEDTRMKLIGDIVMDWLVLLEQTQSMMPYTAVALWYYSWKMALVQIVQTVWQTWKCRWCLSHCDNQGRQGGMRSVNKLFEDWWSAQGRLVCSAAHRKARVFQNITPEEGYFRVSLPCQRKFPPCFSWASPITWPWACELFLHGSFLSTTSPPFPMSAELGLNKTHFCLIGYKQ